MVNFERFEMRLDPETAEKIDTWRNKNDANKTRAEAVRELVSIGYEAKDNDKLYEIMRLNILLNKEQFIDQYGEPFIFAWYVRIHPFFSEHDICEPFKDNSIINKPMLDEMFEFLADHFDENKDIEYRNFELKFKANNSKYTSRMNLINFCRYVFLSNRFDENFWNNFMKNAPSEAKIINKIFDIEKVYVL